MKLIFFLNVIDVVLGNKKYKLYLSDEIIFELKK